MSDVLAFRRPGLTPVVLLAPLYWRAWPALCGNQTINMMNWSSISLTLLLFALQIFAKDCTLAPLGAGKDDTNQVNENLILYLLLFEQAIGRECDRGMRSIRHDNFPSWKLQHNQVPCIQSLFYYVNECVYDSMHRKMTWNLVSSKVNLKGYLSVRH